MCMFTVHQQDTSYWTLFWRPLLNHITAAGQGEKVRPQRTKTLFFSYYLLAICYLVPPDLGHHLPPAPHLCILSGVQNPEGWLKKNLFTFIYKQMRIQIWASLRDGSAHISPCISLPCLPQNKRRVLIKHPSKPLHDRLMTAIPAWPISECHHQLSFIECHGVTCIP